MTLFRLLISIPGWIAIGVVIGVLLAITDYETPDQRKMS